MLFSIKLYNARGGLSRVIALYFEEGMTGVYSFLDGGWIDALFMTGFKK